MKILCFIDTLGGGGAQRQIVTLACTMIELGHQVQVLTYYPHDFFLPLLQKYGIPYKSIAPYPSIRRFYLLAREFRNFKGNAVLSFLEGPSLYAEIFGMMRRNWGLVVSERSTFTRDNKRRHFRMFHNNADYIVCNSHTTTESIVEIFPKYKDKTRCIYNAVDLDYFQPDVSRSFRETTPIRLIAVANYSENKNVVSIIQALIQCKQKDMNFEFDWYGKKADEEVFKKAMVIITSAGMEKSIRLNGQVNDISEVYRVADALILGSFEEGLPNAVCEAMASGLPILMSNITDAHYLVEPGVNGFLFDPHKPEEITRQLMSCFRLSRIQLHAMGRASLQKAEMLFNRIQKTRSYLKLLEESYLQHNKGRVLP